MPPFVCAVTAAVSENGLLTTGQISRGGEPMTTTDLNPAQQLLAQGYH